MKHYYDTFSTPFGKFSVAVDEDGAVISTTFGGREKFSPRHVPHEAQHEPRKAAKARRELTEFFQGKRHRFTVKLAPRGTDFQKQVWAALQNIPFGQTRSYGDLAVEVGRPKAFRAVGQANGHNPICVIVPCHRCIGADGSLAGFAFGGKLKQQLLDLEGVKISRAE
jgi:methylated-DNA-[protein]-cysteine S-methyltransferase